MKRFIVCALLVVAFGVYSHVQAQFKNPRMAIGAELGGAIGDNATGDKWGIHGRGYFQYEFVPAILGQAGVGYSDLNAPDYYTAQVLTPDLRLLFVPISLPNLNPFAYVGFGVSKTLNLTNSNWLPIVPLGLGAQTRISSGLLLQISGGYNLCLSDELDGRTRTDSKNFLTNGKNDGFYTFSVGIAFSKSGDDEEVRQAKADADARRARELANAEARRVQDSTNAAAKAARLKQANEAEAQRVKDSTNAASEAARLKAANAAEARRVQDSTNAAVEAARLKAANAAEARRVKELADAEARRLAEQKGADTVFVLIKGKTIVLRGVNFEFNKATLTKESERILWRAYNAMVANPNVRVVITGHTDNIGGQKFNQGLSLKRAQAVKNWLVKKGIASNRMRTVGRGQNEPVASNDTDEGRAENRRMEFYVQ
jgi:outer membrane protein OmpA-like peptidoglycan-associated protein